MVRTHNLLALVMMLALLLSSAAIMLPARQAFASDYWSVTLTADAGSDGASASLEFGTRLSATDGFDRGGIDVPVAPPAPSATFRCWFVVTDPIFPELSSDYRSLLAATPGSTIVWTLSIRSSSQPIRLDWPDLNAAGVPADVSLILSGGGQTTNMRATSSATYASGTHELTITASRSTTTVPVDDDSADTSDSQDESTDGGGMDDTVDSTTSGTADETATGTEPNEDIPGQNGSVDNTNLIITPAQVLLDQEVTISASICNNGGEHVTRTVSLLVNGTAEHSQSIDLSGGACQQIAFKVSKPTPGTYQVAVDGMAGQFSVLGPTTVTTGIPSTRLGGLSTTGIVAIIAVVVILIFAIILVFRRM